MPSCSVTAFLKNNTPYILTYQSAATELGNYYNRETTIAPYSTVEIFFASATEGAATACRGAVIYGFTDQNGHQQAITLTYSDPFVGPNSFGVTNLPNGFTGSATQPSGLAVSVIYTIGVS